MLASGATAAAASAAAGRPGSGAGGAAGGGAGAPTRAVEASVASVFAVPAGLQAATGSTPFSCPKCLCPLVAKQLENIAGTATRLASKFSEQLRSSGIQDMLAKLRPVKLGA